MSQRLASPPAWKQSRINLAQSGPRVVAHNQVAVWNAPDGCEAEVCMSHMDPVSGTDIDLFIEGIIPCSLHLKATQQSQTLNVKRPIKKQMPL